MNPTQSNQAIMEQVSKLKADIMDELLNSAEQINDVSTILGKYAHRKVEAICSNDPSMATLLLVAGDLSYLYEQAVSFHCANEKEAS